MLKFMLSFVVFASGCGSTDSTVMPEEGQSWWIDLAQAVVVDPEEANGLISLVSDDYSTLVSTINVTDTSFDLLFAIGEDGGGQDLCSRTAELGGISLAEDGSFSFGPEDFALANGITNQDLEVSGTFSEDASLMNDIVIKGSVVLSSIPEDMLPLGGTDICELLESIELECGACRDGDIDCLYIHTAGLSGKDQPGVTLEEVTEADLGAECEQADTGGD